MKKPFFFLVTMLIAVSLKAQFNYTFSHYTGSYLPLSNGVGVNNGIIWDNEVFEVPIGFTFNMDGINITTLTIVGGLFFGTDINTNANGFMPLGADFVDRGAIGDTISMSPIRYELAGNSPNRIFKLEMFNAGFYDETFVHSELSDSINFQIWLYEGTDVVEFHYGDARTEYFDEYFTFDSSAVSIGYLKQVNFTNNTLNMFYYLDGDPLNPMLNETNEIDELPELGTDTIPPSGMVYRFTPVPVSVPHVKNARQAFIYPTLCRGYLFVELPGDEQVNYDIISATGVKVSKGTAGKGRSKIDVSQLPAGNYLIRFTARQGIETLKFSKSQ